MDSALPTSRCLWANLSDEEDTTPWERLSVYTADSFDDDVQQNVCLARDGGANASPKLSTTYTDVPVKEEGRYWSSSSSFEACTSANTGMYPYPSSSSASWSASTSFDLTQFRNIAQGFDSSSIASHEVPARRLRIKNKKLEVPRKVVANVSMDDKHMFEFGEKATEVPPPLVQVRPKPPFPANPQGEGEWSVGSAKHDTGRCRRCLFFDSPVGCVKGANCDFCHLAHFRSSCTRPSKAKRDRYARLFKDIAEKQSRRAQREAELRRLTAK